MTLALTDSWGDGWDSAFMSVSIGGAAASEYTVAPSSASHEVCGDPGSSLGIDYTEGAWRKEHSYTIRRSDGTAVAAGSSSGHGLASAKSIDVWDGVFSAEEMHPDFDDSDPDVGPVSDPSD